MAINASTGAKNDAVAADTATTLAERASLHGTRFSTATARVDACTQVLKHTALHTRILAPYV